MSNLQPPVPDIPNYKGNPALSIIIPISNAKYNPLRMQKHAERVHLRTEAWKGSAVGPQEHGEARQWGSWNWLVVSTNRMRGGVTVQGSRAVNRIETMQAATSTN